MDEDGPGGGSLALGELVDEHGPALVADFLSEYGIRLADILFVWSPREVLALVEGLPASGRFQAHLVGGDKWHEFWGWDADRHLQANLWDLHVAVNTPKGKKAEKYPRPTANKQAQGIPFLAMVPRRRPKGD